MYTTLLHLKILIAFVCFLLLYAEYRRTRDFKIRIMYMLMFVFFFKEAFYLFYLQSSIDFSAFTKVLEGAQKSVKDLPVFQGDFINRLGDIAREPLFWDKIRPQFERFNLYWNLIEAAFCAMLVFQFSRWVSLREKSKGRTVGLLVNLLLLAGGLFLTFTVRLEMGNVPLTLIYWGMFLWRLLLLVMVMRIVGKVYSLTMLDLKYLVENRPAIFTATVALSLFYLFNNLTTPSNTAAFPVFFQLLALLSFAYYCLRYVQFGVVENEQKVLEVENERSLVIKLLQDIGHAMAENLSQEIVMERIVSAATKAADARSGCVLLKDKFSDTLNVEYVQGFYPPVHQMELSGSMVKEKFLVDKFKSSHIKIGENENYLGWVAATGQSLYIRDCLRDERVEQTASGLMDIRSLIAVPLRIQEETLGVMSILNKESASTMFFSEGDLSLMETLADQAAITLNQVKLYQEMLEKKQAEKELSVAGNIQQGLLPSEFPDFPRIEISAFSHAAKGVGGDYYDLLDFGNGKVGIIVTDVAGKGVPAALVMVMIRSVLRTYAKQDKEAKDVITTVNETISGEVTEERYATMFYFVFDSEYKILNYCNAGHGPLLLYRNNLDSFALLDTEGMPVGIAPGVEYGQEYTSLHSGDVAILYTDGITECMNEHREQFGLERLKQLVRENKDLPAKQLTDTIYESLRDFAGNAPQHDDETLLLMKAK